ncbi:MAG: MarR family transcriptional regulator [Phycisphaeraceae bacterium]|nr:MarR family transcriptional regulator [Phycisphaeraceae bacterium]
MAASARETKRRSEVRRSRRAVTGSLASEIGKREGFDSASQEAYLSLARTASELGGGFAALFRSSGLSESSYNVLRILRGHHPEGIPSQTIGREMVVRVPDVTRLVDRLVRAGLAERERLRLDRRGKRVAGELPDRSARPDRRCVLVRITPAGLSLLAKLDRPVMALHDRQLGHMSRAELVALIELLGRARGGDTDARKKPRE